MTFLTAPGVTEVPVEARAFLGAVAAFVVLFFVFFLYLNKKLCFYSSGAFPCCDEATQHPSDIIKDLGPAFKYEENKSISESIRESNKRIGTSKNYQQSMRDQQHQQLVPKQDGYQSYQACQHNYHQLGPSRSNSQMSNREYAKSGSSEVSPDEVENLISLAEKGRAGMDEMSGNVIVSSSSASSSGSTTSGDDELLTHRTLRHRDPRSYRHLSPSRSPYQHRFIPEDLLGISEEALFAKCGSLEAGFSYDLPTRTLTVHILQAKDVPSKEKSGPPNSQVRLLLFPIRKQRQKTKIRTGENPQFNEAFVFTKVNPEDVSQLGIRLRLCACERMKRERIVGEAIVPLSSINMGMGNNVWLNLEPRAPTMLQHVEERIEVGSLPRSDSSGSNHSAHGGLPELLLGLTYNGTTGRLAVEVIKGSHFRHLDDYRNLNNSRPPDTYVKLTLTSSSGQEIGSSKSSIRRGQPSPLFKETFIFQIALFQLPDVTLLVSVCAKRTMKRKDVIGWFSLGLNSSSDDELTHWNAMRDSQGEQITRWHILLDS